MASAVEKTGRIGLAATSCQAKQGMDVALDRAQHAMVAMALAALVGQLMKGVNQERMQALLA
jgi:hypothetical protein